MVNATIVESYYDAQNPNLEFAELTVSTGQTYQSKRFGKVLFALACGGANNDAHINTVVSGSQVTINYAGMTAQKVYLLVYGKA